MIFQSTVSTPANTAISIPKETIFKCVKGLIYKVSLYFPPGSRGLTGLQMFDANYQVYPTTVDEWFTGDNVQYNFDDTYFKSAEPFNFVIKTYNLDNLYAHEIVFQLGMVSEKIFIARFVPSEQYELMKEILQEIATEQAQARKAVVIQGFPVG